MPCIFAAKTTASGLIALFVAFTFNLDEPYWALLTVFIVSQPLQSGQVLAKSLYRVIGTVIGAGVALLFVALFAQERVLFLGALALWIGLCAFGSQYARNFAAYSFVLSGYTVAIVGIPGALDAGNAFYIATGRVTEVCLGIIVAATVNHIILPTSMVPSLWQVAANAHAALADYALALFGAGDTAQLQAKLLGQAIEIENFRASAIFEDREIRARSNALRFLDLALINSVGAAQLLRWSLDALGPAAASIEAGIDEAIAEAIAAIKRWRVAAIDAAGLGRGLVRARARLPLVRQLCCDRSSPDAEVIGRIAAVARLREFFGALTAYAESYEAVVSGEKPEARPISFAHSNDPVAALWTGLRAALAVFVVSSFWILTNWAHGSTAAVLGAVATARLATMAPAVPVALGATLSFALATIPAVGRYGALPQEGEEKTVQQPVVFQLTNASRTVAGKRWLLQLARRFQLLANNFDRHPHLAEKGTRLDHLLFESIKSGQSSGRSDWLRRTVMRPREHRPSQRCGCVHSYRPSL